MRAAASRSASASARSPAQTTCRRAAISAAVSDVEAGAGAGRTGAGASTRSDWGTSRPSDSSSMRSTCCITKGSCVAVTIVTPSSATARSSPKICAPVAESSSPVGSSAMMHAGVVRERARDRHALLLAAGQLVRPVVRPPREAHELDQLARPFGALSRRPAPAIRSASSTFSAAESSGSSPNDWNTNPSV